MSIHKQNWSGHVPFHAARFHEPTTLAAVQEIVRNAENVHVIGSRHCFNDIADTTGDLLSLAKMESQVVIDEERHTATVNAGITYGELCPQLHAAGYALPNMASLHHITVVGACMTATHGSGDAHGNLATAVSALEMVTASGDLVTLTREQDGDQFNGAVVALGALGVVTKVTLDLLPTFQLQQDIYEWLPMHELDASFDAIMSAGYSVSLFPKWQTDDIDTVWVKQQVAPGASATVPGTFFGATLATHNRPIQDASDRHGTPMGEPVPWHECMPHFVFTDPLLEGDELQSEYFVPRHHAVDAMKAVARHRDALAPILGVSEIRTVAADKLWLSPAYEQDIVGIHFNWLKNWAEVEPFLAIVEETLAPFTPRPHWGKLFILSPAQVQSAYPRMQDFQALAESYDPSGKFRNAYLDHFIFGNG